MKQCKLCGQIKRYEDFYPMPQNLDGVRGECRACSDYKNIKTNIVRRLRRVIKLELQAAPYRALVRMLKDDVELMLYIRNSNISKFRRYLLEEKTMIVLDIKKRSFRGRKKKSRVPHEDVWSEIFSELDFMPNIDNDSQNVELSA